MSKVYQSGDYIAVHRNPIWHEKSNFMIRAYLENNEGRNEWEQIWAKKIDEKKFLVCCIPFFAYNIALGDEVITDENYVIRNTIKNSEYFTHRIWFDASGGEDFKADVLLNLETMSTLMEWSSDNLLAVSPKGESQNQKILNYLDSCQDTGKLIYETG